MGKGEGARERESVRVRERGGGEGARERVRVREIGRFRGKGRTTPECQLIK